MTNYRCIVYDERGKKRKVDMQVENEVELKIKLSEQNLFLESYKEAPVKKYNSFFTLSLSVKRSEIVVFFRQFSVMLNSGISIDDTLNALRLQNYSSGLKKILDDVYNEVVSGNLLSTAFRSHSDVFPEFFCNMVEIGELSGTLDNVFSSMADYYENDEKLKLKARSSLAYPTVLVVLILAVILFMTYFILPQFESMFAEFDGEIPTISKIVFATGAFIRNNMKMILIVIASTVAVLLIFFHTPPGRRVKDWFALHLPIVGKINRAVITARFSRAFSILLKSGMNITDAINNLINILQNSIYIDHFKVAIEEIKRGKTIATSLQNAKVFNPLLVQMVSVGERSGNLEEVLDSTTVFFDDQVDTNINKAISLLEPITIILLGAVVAVVLLSIYIPMIELMDQI